MPYTKASLGRYRYLNFIVPNTKSQVVGTNGYILFKEYNNFCD